MTNSSKNTHWEKIIAISSLLGVVLFLFGIVCFFSSDLISKSKLVDKGAVGDALNGMTAPFISLIGATLLFYSFMAQLKANKMQIKANQMLQTQWQFDTYYKLYNEIEKAFSLLEATETVKDVDETKDKINVFKGSRYIDLIARYADQEEFVPNFLPSLEFIIEDILVLIQYVNDSDMPQKQFFLHRINRFYQAFLKESLQNLQINIDHDNQLFKEYFRTYNLLLKAIDKINKKGAV